VPESTGEATPALLDILIFTGEFAYSQFKRCSAFPVRASRSIPATGHGHSRCPGPRRAWFPALTPENAGSSPPPVLHCLPLPGLRGGSLQFQPFDQSYLERLRAGDYRAQEHFGAYFGALIQIKLRSRLKSPEAIEDVRQETFSRFFVALREGRILQPERLGSFVNSICNNVLLEHYRAGSRLDSLDDDEKPRDFPDKGTDLLSILAAKETEKKVREILEQLSERDRRLLREVFLEERDKDEVCRDFGVDRDYLRVLLHRAKQSFKSLYLKDMGDNGPQFILA
jgi:RNA polymerase sigma-70 factor (ECF subfamily)